MDKGHRISNGNLLPAQNASRDSQPANNSLRGGESTSLRRTHTVEEAGDILGLSGAIAYARAKDGSLPTIRMGKRLLVPSAALDRLLMTT